jgi:hypothetical protein
MSREAGMGMAGKTGDYGNSSSNTGGGDGDNAREQYSAARTQTPRTQEVSVTRDGGGQVVTEDPYVMVGGQRYAVGDPAIQEAQNIVDQRNLLEKTIDLYQQYSPFGLLSNIFTGDAKTAFGNNDERGGGGERDLINLLTPYAPYAISDTTPQQSMVNQYFSNLGMSNQPLSSNLQTDYNNAKTNINSLLGILPPSQQFGYSTAPYGLLSSTNLASNPFNIDYLQQRGLI